MVRNGQKMAKRKAQYLAMDTNGQEMFKISRKESKLVKNRSISAKRIAKKGQKFIDKPENMSTRFINIPIATSNVLRISNL